MTRTQVSKVRIGDLRHRITFQSIQKTPDGQGGFLKSWTNIEQNPTVWAYIKPVSSRERLFSQQVQYQRSHTCIIRYRDDIDSKMRILFDNRIFQIKGFFRPDERKFFVELDLEENQGT